MFPHLVLSGSICANTEETVFSELKLRIDVTRIGTCFLLSGLVTALLLLAMDLQHNTRMETLTMFRGYAVAGRGAVDGGRHHATGVSPQS